MAKATIEIEMPGSCLTCMFRRIDILTEDSVCRITNRELSRDDIWAERPRRCPLKEVKECSSV